jgi:hypothetical protein
LAAGDAVCQAEADAAGLEGTFVAWLSDDSDDAYCRVHGLSGKKVNRCGEDVLPSSAGGWRRTDGVAFARGITDAGEGRVYVPLRIDANGAESWPGLAIRAWTGTGSSGEVQQPHCAAWTDTVGSAVMGEKDGIGTRWTYAGTSRCDGDSSGLYCFQLGEGPSLNPPQAIGKIAFVTSVRGSGDLSTWPDAGLNTGLAAADAICQARATAGSLPNAMRFKAWISTQTSPVYDRITSDGPWVRLDGLPIADSNADLFDREFFTGIMIDELGQATTGLVWTGTRLDREEQLIHCLAWTIESEDEMGYAGNAQSAGSLATSGTLNRCSSSSRLYCFED